MTLHFSLPPAIRITGLDLFVLMLFATILTIVRTRCGFPLGTRFGFPLQYKHLEANLKSLRFTILTHFCPYYMPIHIDLEKAIKAIMHYMVFESGLAGLK